MTAPSVESCAHEPRIASGEDWQLHLGDCLEGLRGLGEKSVDVVITDPPYDEHTHANGRRGSESLHGGYVEKQSSRKATISRARSLGFGALTASQMADSAQQFARVVRRWVLVFCSLEMLSDWKASLERAGLEYIRTCLWRKLNGAPQFTGDRPAVAAEAIVVAHRPGRKRWNGGGKQGLYESAIVLERGHGEVRLHTTQKPLPLMRALVEDFTEPGELVLDAYAGSATTLLACRQLGRRSIGFELSPDYFEIACRRLRGERAKPVDNQPELFR